MPASSRLPRRFVVVPEPRGTSGRGTRSPLTKPAGDENSNDGEDDTGKYGLIGLSGLLGLFGYKKYRDTRATRATGTGTDGPGSRRVT